MTPPSASSRAFPEAARTGSALLALESGGRLDAATTMSAARRSTVRTGHASSEHSIALYRSTSRAASALAELVSVRRTTRGHRVISRYRPDIAPKTIQVREFGGFARGTTPAAATTNERPTNRHKENPKWQTRTNQGAR
jgi:hypothetical protein